MAKQLLFSCLCVYLECCFAGLNDTMGLNLRCPQGLRAKPGSHPHRNGEAVRQDPVSEVPGSMQTLPWETHPFPSP